MTLDDILKLEDDEAAEKEQSSDEHESGTDYDAAELEEEDDAPLFRLAGAKPAPSQPSAKVSVECLNVKRFLF